MKTLCFLKSAIYLILALGMNYQGVANNNIPTAEQQQLLDNNKSKISFQENKGQVHDQNYQLRPDVLFSGQTNGMVFHLKNKGISYQLNRIDSYKDVEDEYTGETRKEIAQSTIYRIDINWLNTNSNPAVHKGEALEGFNNYYLEHCPDGALNVLNYENITYQNIYNGIDLKWYSKDGTLKYDYLVAAGADYQQIQFEIKGAESIAINKNGELEIKTPLGTIIEEAPYVVQDGRALKSQWTVVNNTIRFHIEDIDPTKPFIIDPAIRQWGTYYGGTGNESGQSCAVDASSNVYLAGYTQTIGGTNIATTGSHQSTHGGGSDAFLVQFNSLGVRQWGTYYGGAQNDSGESCAVNDASGNVYLAGYTKTTSGTSIATAGSHQTTYGGGITDAFLVQFNSLGVRQWGTYYGGIGDDPGHSCAVDASGNVYLTGHTSSATGTIIATTGSHQDTHGGGADAFLVKFNSSGVRQWGTYYGGAGNDQSNQNKTCAVDAFGNVYLTGYTTTTTSTAIATTGSHQDTYGGGARDAFLVQFNSSGVRQWGTYYGGTGTDHGLSCAVNASGNVYMTGHASTTTGTNIATTGSHQDTYGGGTYDGYLVQFNSSGVRQWGTYYGGAGYDIHWSCAVDASGNVYLAGRTTTTTGTNIATISSHQDTYGGGSIDAYLVQFNSLGVRQWGTYYGGTGDDAGVSCAVGASSNVYLVGYTATTTGTNIATTGSHQSTHGGGIDDAYLVQFVGCSSSPTQPSSITGNTIICSSTSQTYSVTNDPNATSYTWTLPGGWSGTSTTNSINATAGATGGTISVTANNACGSSTLQILNVTVNTVPATPSVISGSTNFCEDATAQTYSVTNDPNATSYTWSLPATWTGTSTTNSINATAGTSGGTISVTANNSCGNSTVQTLNVTINALPTVIASGTATICNGQSTNLSASGASTYSWDNGAGTGATVSVSPTTTTTYTVTGTDVNTCVNTAQVTVTVNPLPTVVASGTATICEGQSTNLSASGASTYSWDNGAGTGATVSVSPTTTTTYTVTGTDANTCVNTAQVTVTVNPLPTVVYTQTPNIVCENDAPFALTGGSPSGGVYSGTGVSAGNFDPAVAGAGIHTITYSFTDGNNCSNSDTQQIQVDVCAGIDEQPNQPVTIYPNPFKNEFTVKFTTSGNHTIELVNVLGEQLKLINVYEQNTVINTDDLPSGVYFLRIIDEKLIFKLLKN